MSAVDDARFADVLSANAAYTAGFHHQGLAPRAGRGLAILTCMDSRIEPLAMLGLQPGDAKILRNAGARVTDDVLRTLTLATYLLGVERAMVIAHTNCLMAETSEADVRAALREAGGPDSELVPYLVTDDQQATLRADVERVRSLREFSRIDVGGFIYDVDTGRVTQIC
jgi:carbonic anhydrase